MQILDGKKLSKKILSRLKKEICGRKLTLAVVYVGKNSVSKSYILQKQKACKKIGVDFELYNFPQNIKEKQLFSEIEKIAGNKLISGIVIQLPLPKNINSQKILNIIPIKKDIDVLSEESFNKFCRGKLNILPPVACAVNHFIKEYKISLLKKNIVLVGFGRLVGKPVAAWLSNQKIKYFMIDKSTKNILPLILKADVIISGTGQPSFVKGNMVKEGAVVIDAGTSTESGKIRGDVDFKSVSKKASYMSPVPGGVGPLTVACLIENLVKLSNKK